jgi:hypothetical protein
LKRDDLKNDGSGDRKRFFRDLRLIVRDPTDQKDKRMKSTATEGKCIIILFSVIRQTTYLGYNNKSNI